MALQEPAHITEHRMLYGPLHPYLETAFIAEVARRRAKDPLGPLVIAVGSNLLSLYLKRRLALAGVPHFNLRFVTLLDLARSLADATLATEGLRPMPALGDLRLAAGIGANLPPESYFAPVMDRPGFARALLATFTDLREAGWEGWEEPADSVGKPAEVGALFNRYMETWADRFYDTSQLFAVAVRQAGGFAAVHGTRELLVYGFYDFNPRQRRLIAACAEQVDVTAFFPWPAAAARRFAEPTRAWYEGLGFKAEPVGLGDTVSQVAKDVHVSFISAPGEVREVREVAREILQLAREGIPFHDMAVLYRGGPVYATLIHETFASLQIPIYQPAGRALADTRGGRSLLLLLDLIGGSLQRFEVMEFLTHAPLRPDAAGPGHQVTPAEWDRLSREAGIIGGSTDWDQCLAKLARRLHAGGPEGRGAEAQALHTFMARFLQDLEAFPRQGPWSTLVQATRDLVLGYLEGPEVMQALDSLDVLRDLDEVEGEVGLGSLRTLAADVLRRNRPAIGRFQRGSVTVADVMAARGLSFAVVFLVGMVEQGFPAPVRQDPILLDHERSALNRHCEAENRLDLKSRRSQEEACLFALAVGSAREGLVLSFPRTDVETGKERMPSSYLLQVGAELLGKPVQYADLAEIPGFRRIPLSRLAPADPALALDEREYDLARAMAGAPHDQSLSYLQQLYPAFARARRVELERWGRRRLTPYDGRLQETAALALVQEICGLRERPHSPTSLEEYATCPFRYFLNRVLRIPVLEDPAPGGISPLERGQLIHEILRRFYAHAKQQDLLPLSSGDVDLHRSALDQVAADVFRDAEDRGVTGYPLLWDLQRAEILEDLWQVVEEEAGAGDGWVPVQFEVGFGGVDGGRGAGVVLESDAGPVAFRGRMDRVDRSAVHRAYRVVDYKTGANQGSHAIRAERLHGGKALQLPIYLLALQRLFGVADMEGLQAEYFFVTRAGKRRRVAFSGQDWAAKEQRLRRVLNAIATGMDTGMFAPNPGQNRGNCRACPYYRVCDPGVEPLFRRKAGDPALAPYLSLQEVDDDGSTG